jgi:hypothetical protein
MISRTERGETTPSRQHLTPNSAHPTLPHPAQMPASDGLTDCFQISLLMKTRAYQKWQPLQACGAEKPNHPTPANRAQKQKTENQKHSPGFLPLFWDKQGLS